MFAIQKYEEQISVVAALRGTLMVKTHEVAKQIIEEMSSNVHWRKKTNIKKGGTYEVDALFAIRIMCKD